MSPQTVNHAREIGHTMGKNDANRNRCAQALLAVSGGFIQGYEGLLRQPMCVDATAQALLNGVDSVDGGGMGLPLKMRGKSACYFNAVALGGLGANKCETPDETLGLSLSVLVTVIPAPSAHAGIHQ